MKQEEIIPLRFFKARGEKDKRKVGVLVLEGKRKHKARKRGKNGAGVAGLVKKPLGKFPPYNGPKTAWSSGRKSDLAGAERNGSTQKTRGKKMAENSQHPGWP